MYEQALVPVSRNLIDSVAADFAGIQVVQYLELVVETQLLVQELHQLFETACLHIRLRLKRSLLNPFQAG
jgi:hypothetical protein